MVYNHNFQNSQVKTKISTLHLGVRGEKAGIPNQFTPASNKVTLHIKQYFCYIHTMYQIWEIILANF